MDVALTEMGISPSTVTLMGNRSVVMFWLNTETFLTLFIENFLLSGDTNSNSKLSATTTITCDGKRHEESCFQQTIIHLQQNKPTVTCVKVNMIEQYSQTILLSFSCVPEFNFVSQRFVQITWATIIIMLSKYLSARN